MKQECPISIYPLILQILIKTYTRKTIIDVFKNLSMSMVTTELFIASVNYRLNSHFRRADTEPVLFTADHQSLERCLTHTRYSVSIVTENLLTK